MKDNGCNLLSVYHPIIHPENFHRQDLPKCLSLYADQFSIPP